MSWLFLVVLRMRTYQGVTRVSIVVSVCVVALLGCSAPVEVVDMGPLSPEPGLDRPAGERPRFYGDMKAWSRGSTLILEFENPGPARVVRVTPVVYQGDLYVDTVGISGAGPTSFEIDVSKLGMGPDWTDRVYVFTGSWDRFWSYSRPLPQYTKRWKVGVKPLP